MKTTKMIKRNYLLVMTMLAGMVLFSACSDDEDNAVNEEPTPENVVLAEDATLGKYLTDKNGLSLYYFTKDLDGTSQCEDGCLASWPIFYEKEIKVSAGLESSDFGVITRADGSKQNTYKGWPLYYFASDTEKGDIKGENVGEVWFVAKPDYSVMIADFEVAGEAEKFLVDAEGNSLYLFTVDGENESNCNDGCVTSWPLFFDDEVVVPSLLNAGDFQSITREDGGKQLSYKGSPLYYFNSDSKRGEVKGQGVGGNWFVIDASATN